MASSSSTKLTKYESAVTILTAEVANSWFGGLYGSAEGDDLSDTDPLVAGHVHDGSHQDGHAQKINLVHHVTSQLKNVNLANDAVTKRNVASFSDQGQAIPEYEIIDGVTFYHLDLSTVYDAIPNTFTNVGIQASGGTVTGDGAVVMTADSTSDTLVIQAGTGIEIETDESNDTFTIKSTASGGNSFETIGLVANGGTVNGTFPIVADSPGDTLNLEAGAGIIFTGDSSSDTIQISKTDAFADLGTKFQGRGSSNGSSVIADSVSDQATMVAEDGMEVSATPASDEIIFRNRYAFSHLVQEPEGWAADDAGGWGTIQLRNYSEGSEVLNYKYLLVDTDSINYLAPIPQSLLPERPISFIFRAYFIAQENTLNYLSTNNPVFNIDCQFGSRAGQASPNLGVTGNNEHILAGIGGGADYWEPASPIVLSATVNETNRLYIVETSLQTIQTGNNPLGLIGVRLDGQNASFGTGNPFDNNGARAQLHFVKSDFTWFI
jgi:hypothetical protein